MALLPREGGGHQLELRSSQPGVQPLTIALDDAELADLVRCLDAMRLDPRVQIAWPELQDRPLARRELVDRTSLVKRLAAPVLGSSALVVVAVLASLIPLPELKQPKPVEPAVESTTPASSAGGSTSPVSGAKTSD